MTFSEKARKYPDSNGRFLKRQLVKEGRRSPCDGRSRRGDGWEAALGLMEVGGHSVPASLPHVLLVWQPGQNTRSKASSKRLWQVGLGAQSMNGFRWPWGKD